jgi:hypothetical protein
MQEKLLTYLPVRTCLGVLLFGAICLTTTPSKIKGDNYDMSGSVCTATNGATCESCIASVEQSTGGVYMCYLTMCDYDSTRFYTCVFTSGNNNCCRQTVQATETCSGCQYWYCNTVNASDKCGVSLCGKDGLCPTTGGTPWKPAWHMFYCVACP